MLDLEIVMMRFKDRIEMRVTVDRDFMARAYRGYVMWYDVMQKGKVKPLGKYEYLALIEEARTGKGGREVRPRV